MVSLFPFCRPASCQSVSRGALIPDSCRRPRSWFHFPSRFCSWAILAAAWGRVLGSVLRLDWFSSWSWRRCSAKLPPVLFPVRKQTTVHTTAARLSYRRSCFLDWFSYFLLCFCGGFLVSPRRCLMKCLWEVNCCHEDFYFDSWPSVLQVHHYDLLVDLWVVNLLAWVMFSLWFLVSNSGPRLNSFSIAITTTEYVCSINC
jgi:hypothetical protein